MIRYLLAEGAVLAAGAAAVGIALAALGIGLVQRFGAAFVPRTTEIVLAGRTLWILIAVTAISTAIFGLVPALHGTGGPVDEGLRSLGRSSTGSARVRRLRRTILRSKPRPRCRASPPSTSWWRSRWKCRGRSHC